METNGSALPVVKIDRSNWDHDPMPVEVRATDLIAGDLVPGLGILDAILDPGLKGFGHDLVLCSGADSLTVRWFDQVTAHGAICPDCDMHPDDCEAYGCGADDADIYCEQCNDYH